MSFWNEFKIMFAEAQIKCSQNICLCHKIKENKRTTTTCSSISKYIEKTKCVLRNSHTRLDTKKSLVKLIFVPSLFSASKKKNLKKLNLFTFPFETFLFNLFCEFKTTRLTHLWRETMAFPAHKYPQNTHDYSFRTNFLSITNFMENSTSPWVRCVLIPHHPFLMEYFLIG